MSRPTNYAHWHEIYHDNVKTLGFVAHGYFGLKRKGKIGVIQMLNYPRRIWELQSRIDRIENQLDICREANDPEWLRHVANCMTNHTENEQS